MQTAEPTVDKIKERTCRGCGKVSHSVDKRGRLQHPRFCPYCGIENPYPTTSLRTVALVGVLLVLGMLAISMLR
jgi:hypothetical protein